MIRRGQPDARWNAVAGLAAGVAVSNAFGRFAYGLLVPSMQRDLSLTLTELGWLTTANSIGYALGALWMVLRPARGAESRVFLLGMAGVAASLLVTAVVDSVAPLSALRLIGGLAGAFTFISGSALVASLFEEDPQARAVAISAFFAGGGAGMLLCGLVIPPLVAGCDNGSWRLGWTFLGVASALATILSVRTLRGVFSALSETAYGRADGALQVRRMIPALFSYFLFALGYLVYLTFIVARAERAGMGNTGTMALWSIMSVAMIAAPFLWRRAIVGYGHGAMVLAASIALTGAASVLPSLSGHKVPLLASAALFGIAVFAVPSAVTAFCRANLARSEWQRSIGLFTLVFAIGQTIGPFAAGWVGDVSGNLSLPFLGASLVLGCAAAIACLQRSLRPLG